MVAPTSDSATARVSWRFWRQEAASVSSVVYLAAGRRGRPRVRSRYIAGWSAWNHVRSALALAAAAILIASIRVG